MRLSFICRKGAKTSRKQKSTLCLLMQLWVLCSDVSSYKHVVGSWRTSFIPKAVPKEVKINKKKQRQSAKLHLGDSFDHLEDSFKLQPELLFLRLLKGWMRPVGVTEPPGLSDPSIQVQAHKSVEVFSFLQFPRRSKRLEYFCFCLVHCALLLHPSSHGATYPLFILKAERC